MKHFTHTNIEQPWPIGTTVRRTNYDCSYTITIEGYISCKDSCSHCGSGGMQMVGIVKRREESDRKEYRCIKHTGSPDFWEEVE